MKVILNLINRNLKMYYRNTSAVFFSFLSVLIIIGMYILFLGDVQIQNAKQFIGDVPFLKWLSDSWIMAGIICVNTVSITLVSLGTMVEDTVSNVSKDFLSSPIKRSQIIFGYIISSWIVGFVMSALSFVLIEVYIVSTGGKLLSLISMFKVLGIIILSVISLSSLFFFVLTFVKSNNAFSTLNAIVGALIGFLAGIYIPIGILPLGVQKIISIFPVSYSASMLRQIFMFEPTKQIFKNANSQTVTDYYKLYGVELYFNDFKLSWTFMVLVLIGMSIIFYLLSIIRLLKRKM